ncbi:MAG: hypothetical protein ACI9HK_005764, partial [Pirellulaceae bacterium]
MAITRIISDLRRVLGTFVNFGSPAEGTRHSRFRQGEFCERIRY